MFRSGNATHPVTRGGRGRVEHIVIKGSPLIFYDVVSLNEERRVGVNLSLHGREYERSTLRRVIVEVEKRKDRSKKKIV